MLQFRYVPKNPGHIAGWSNVRNYGCPPALYRRHPFCFDPGPLVVAGVDIISNGLWEGHKGWIFFLTVIIRLILQSPEGRFHNTVIVPIAFPWHGPDNAVAFNFFWILWWSLLFRLKSRSLLFFSQGGLFFITSFSALIETVSVLNRVSSSRSTSTRDLDDGYHIFLHELVLLFSGFLVICQSIIALCLWFDCPAVEYPITGSRFTCNGLVWFTC